VVIYHLGWPGWQKSIIRKGCRRMVPYHSG